ncbi:MAG: hypothetical protein ACK502_10080 [Alphaproteobacteria bacterium]
MTEKPAQSWAARSERMLSAEQFEKVRKAASELPKLLQSVYKHVDNKITSKLAQDFIELRGVGSSRSQDDEFRALEDLTADGITVAKEEWFKKVALLYRRAANALMQRPLDETKIWDSQDMQRVPIDALTTMASVLRNMHMMEEVYPLAGQAKGN